MTRKEMLNKALNVVGAKEVNGVFEVTESNKEKLNMELSNNFVLCVNKKNPNLLGVYDLSKKNRFAIVTFVEDAKPAKKDKKEKHSKVLHMPAEGVSKGNYKLYLILLKKFNREEEKVTNINTCADIKIFLKSLNKREYEYIKIYSEEKEVRKSAWVLRQEGK